MRRPPIGGRLIVFAHLGRINPVAIEELDAVSARCPELAAQVAAEAWPDWNTEPRIRELSAIRLALRAHELPQIADWLRQVLAGALDLPYPGPGGHPARGARRPDRPGPGWPGFVTGQCPSQCPG